MYLRYRSFDKSRGVPFNMIQSLDKLLVWSFIRKRHPSCKKRNISIKAKLDFPHFFDCSKDCQGLYKPEVTKRYDWSLNCEASQAYSTVRVSMPKNKTFQKSFFFFTLSKNLPNFTRNTLGLNCWMSAQMYPLVLKKGKVVRGKNFLTWLKFRKCCCHDTKRQSFACMRNEFWAG